jgi:hypothetical protein
MTRMPSIAISLAEKVSPTSCSAAPCKTMANKKAAVLIYMLRGGVLGRSPFEIDSASRTSQPED